MATLEIDLPDEKMNAALGRILRAEDPAATRSAFEKTLAELEGRADWRRASRTLLLCSPKKYRRRVRTTNIAEKFLSVEWLIEEVRRREKPVRIFPNERSAWRLVGALSAERYEEWSTGRLYLNMDEYWQAQSDSPTKMLAPAT